jgi:hypothetical protein
VFKLLIIPILLLSQQMYVSFTGIEYVQGTDSLKVSVRMQYDLFIRDYQQTIFDDLELDYLRSLKPFPADMANNYLNSKIKIFANKKEVFGKLLKMEEDDGDIRFNILYRVDRKPRSITVINTILTGLCSNVNNFTIVRFSGLETGVMFTPEHFEETFYQK